MLQRLYPFQVDELQATRSFISREEQELRDVEREMEEQLNQQHSQVEDRLPNPEKD